MLAWKSLGSVTPVHYSECGRFTVEPGPNGYTASRFEDGDANTPVESQDKPGTLAAAKAWCETLAAEMVGDPVEDVYPREYR